MKGNSLLFNFEKVIKVHYIRSRDSERERYHSSSNTRASSNSRGASVFVFAGTPGASIKKTPVISADKKDVKSTKISKATMDEEQKIIDRELDNEYAAFEWEEFDKEADRDWYDQDENGVIEDSDAHFVGDRERFRLIEEQMDAYNMKANRLKSGQNLKEKEKDDEHNKWELNRMLTSGIFKVNDIKVDFNEDEDSRVILMVHDIKPPFLSGRTVSTKQEDTIQVVKDPTSDFALLAKKGSAVLKSVREKNDRGKMREKFWELAGSKLGNILKLQKRDEDPDTAMVYILLL